MVELLAPAGDLERLKIAYLYGADACYVGGRDFSLRANAHNFSLEELNEACKYAHGLNKKIYVTVNIVFHDEDLTGLKEYLLKLDEIGIDGIIVSDICVMKLWQDLKLKMELHISTQTSTLNYEMVKFWQKLGAKRVVLAREASKEEIKRIKDETGIDIECFIHGAMCTSFSGQCVMSNYATLRDANRGGCAQVCRFKFKYDNDNPIYSMTAKDLNMVPYLEDMIKRGVNSFKVEGRMRSIYYLGTVIGTYRKLIDMALNNVSDERYNKYALKVLERCANRESIPQFYNQLPGKNEEYFLDKDEVANQDFLGLVHSYNNETHIVTLEVRNYFKKGMKVEFFGPNLENVEYTIDEIRNEDDLVIMEANHPKEIVKIKCDIPLRKDDMMRLKVFDINDIL